MDSHNDFFKELEEENLDSEGDNLQDGAKEKNLPEVSEYYRSERKTKRKSNKGLSFLTVILISLISAMVGGLITAYIAPTYIYGKYIDNPFIGRGTEKVEILPSSENITVASAVAKKAMPSVVGITTVSIQNDYLFGERRSEGLGTGVIVDSRGYIITNSHVVNNGDAEEVNVLLNDGRTLNARVLWNDAVLDLAVVKVEATNLPVADLGDSDNLIVGEIAIAIGNPLGLSFERTVTSGIISGLNRSIDINQYDSIDGLIQTDASINPGNSGGPLLNSLGEVIGINTAKIQTGEGLGFSIPINIAKPIVDEFLVKGEFSKVYLGIRGVEVANYVNNYEELGAEEGVLVHQVTPDSPSANGGLKSGDIIVALDDTVISNMRQLQRELYKYRPGDEATLGIVRDKMNIDINIVFSDMTLQ